MNRADVIILGGGPAGYTAALYATRAGLSTLVLEKMSAGGQMALTTQIDNYPGFDEGIDGFTLGEQMQRGAERFGAKTLLADVTGVELSGQPKIIHTTEGDFEADAVIIATGAAHRVLGLPREEALVGKGVAYCASCDGMRFRGKTVAVVGGGNSAAQDALHLSRLCKEVIVIHRRDTMRATKIYHEPLMQAENVRFLWNSAVADFIADNKLTGLKVRNLLTDEISDLPVDGVFISVGRAPETAFLGGQVAVDAGGYIIADESTHTSVPGVFAAGDVRVKKLRQVVTAVADGAIAAEEAAEYLHGLK